MADSPAPKRSLIWRLWGLIMFLAVAAALASSAYLFVRLKREEAARAALAAEVAAFGPRFEQFKGAVRDVQSPADVQRLPPGRPGHRGLATDRGRLLRHRHLGERRRQGDAHRRQDRQPDLGGARGGAVSRSASTRSARRSRCPRSRPASRSRSRSRCPTSPRPRRRRRSSRSRARPSTSPARRPASARAAIPSTPTSC